MLGTSPKADGLLDEHEDAWKDDPVRPANAGDGDLTGCGASHPTQPVAHPTLVAPPEPPHSGVAAKTSMPSWHSIDCHHLDADGNAASRQQLTATPPPHGAHLPINAMLESTAGCRSPQHVEGDWSRDNSEWLSDRPPSANPPHQEFHSTMRGRYLSCEELELTDAPFRLRAASILYSNTTDSIIALGVVANLFFICLDTDARADQPDSPGGDPADWITLGSFVLWFIFALELVLRCVVERLDMFKRPENVLDCVIIASGAFEAILYVAGVDISAVGMVRALRLCRLLRLLRVLKLFKLLKELNRLIQMMGSCFRTMFWSTLLLLLVMTVWACIAVEVVNPYIQELAEQHGFWGDCQRCQRSYSTVFNANLTLFQTIIAGDSWGRVAVPVIEHYPWSAMVLCGSLMTLVFGILNLIVAVIVDTFAEKRSKDVATIANDLDSAEREERETLQKMFEKVDQDSDGLVTFEELRRGAKRVAELRHWLRVLDIDSDDLHNLFVMVDEDGSGDIAPAEFIDAMYRIKNSESKTAMRFVKHLVTKSVRAQSDMAESLVSLEAKINVVAASLARVLGQRDQHTELQEHTKSRTEADVADFQQGFEQAMADASSITFQAALHAVGSSTPTVGDLRMVIGQDCHLTSPSFMPAISEPVPVCWTMNSTHDALQSDAQCIEDTSTQCLYGSQFLYENGYGSEINGKPDCDADDDSDVDCAPAYSPETLPHVRYSQVSADYDAYPQGGSNQCGVSFAPVRTGESTSGPPELSQSGPGIHQAPSKTVDLGSNQRISEGSPRKFGPKHGTGRPPEPSKTSETGGFFM